MSKHDVALYFKANSTTKFYQQLFIKTSYYRDVKNYHFRVSICFIPGYFPTPIMLKFYNKSVDHGKINYARIDENLAFRITIW